MDPIWSGTEQAMLERLGRRRAELKDSMSSLEHALASPAAGDASRWTDRVQVALIGLSADLRQHVDVTEGPEGLYHDLMQTAPRLAGEVDHLTGEHTVLRKAVDGLLTEVRSPQAEQDVARLRDLGTELLATLSRHRQRGADLVYEAYEVDIGGDT
ncbi:MAG TPA: hypothetical protein VLB29_10550 [Nocardioidaceae bacterium]|nr:hypothetical protein [Nocardioidaceae bacterium]